MTEHDQNNGKGTRWASYILSGLPIPFLLMDAVGKFIKPEPVVTGTLELGYKETVILPLGIVLLVCVVLYAIPRTAVLGAVLLTAYFGGAIATRVRIRNPLLSHILVPVYLGSSSGWVYICVIRGSGSLCRSELEMRVT